MTLHHFCTNSYRHEQRNEIENTQQSDIPLTVKRLATIPLTNEEEDMQWQYSAFARLHTGMNNAMQSKIPSIGHSSNSEKGELPCTFSRTDLILT